MTTPHDKLRAACVEVEEAVAAVAKAEKTRDAAKPRAKTRAQIALFRADDNLTRTALVLAEQRADILSLLDENARLRASAEEAHPRALQAAADVLLRQPSESEWLDDYFRSLARTAENWEAYLVANEAWRAVLAQQRKWEDQQDVRTLAVVLLADVERLRIRPENDKARYGRDQGAADALAARRAPTKGKVKAD